MLGAQFAVYLGAKIEGSYAGFTAEDNFFAILEVEGNVSHEELSSELKKLASHLGNTSTLASFEDHIGQFMKRANLPTSVSLAAALVFDRKIFLKTSGEGQVYIKRGRDFACLIKGHNSASGVLEEGDYFIFTTPRFTTLFDSEKEFSQLDFSKKPHDLIEEITPGLKSRDDTGSVALFVKVAAPRREEAAVEETPVYTAPPLPMQYEQSPDRQPAQPGFFEKLREGVVNARINVEERYRVYGKKKTLTALAVGIIFFIFMWSVVLSSFRREEAQAQKKITASQELITGYLDQAEEVAFLNLGRSQALLASARSELEKLKSELGGKKSQEVKKLEALIKKKEEEILKKESKKEEEFYDLSLEKESARGDKMYLDREQVAILDKSGAVYILSLTKKSITMREDAVAKGAELVALNGDEVFLHRQASGVFKIDTDGKAKKIIERDDEWKKIVGISLFNNALYLLDAAGDQIYKYLPAEDGYSEKTSYIKSGGVDLSTATSLAIDSAVYVGLKDTIVKYLAGSPDDFPASFPEKNISLTKVVTNEDLEKVYVWDKPKGAIYILGKSGVYERQVTAASLKEASDIIVYQDKAYILKGEKIYTIPVD